MSKKEYLEYKKSYLLVPLSISFLLIIGIVVSLVQLRQQQTTQSRAANGSNTAGGNCTVAANDLAYTPEEQKVFDQINEYRKQNNIAPLTLSQTLNQSASWMSRDMMVYNSLSHIDSRGRTLEPRLRDCKFPFPAVVDEIIDSGTSDPNSLLTAWRHSTKHNAILLNPGFNQVGIAFTKSTDGSKLYWAADFAGPAPTPTPTTPPAPTQKIEVTMQPKPTTKVTVAITPVVIPSRRPGSPLLPDDPSNPGVSGLPGRPIPTGQIPSITAVPTIDPTFVRNPLDTQVFVSVKYLGIGKSGNGKPKNLARKVQADVYDLENNLVKSGQGYIGFDKDTFRGIIHLGKIENGKYYLKILSENNLTAVVLPQFQELSSDRLNILPDVLLTQGDLDADNLMTLIDYSVALKCFQDKGCQDAALIDFNDDGVANITDYNILLQGYLRNPGD